MNESQLRSLMDRAVEGQEPAGDLAAKAVRGSQARRRRRQGTVVGLSLAAVIVSGVGIWRAELGGQQPSTAASGRGAPGADNIAWRLSQDTGAVVTVEQILATGQAGDELLVLLKRPARGEEVAAGGKAAELWATTGDGKFQKKSDYLSYDFACSAGDTVCASVRARGLGALVVRHLAGRGTYVFAAVPPGRRIMVTTAEGSTEIVQSDPLGNVVQVQTAEPWQIMVRVEISDTSTYNLPLPPGGVISN